MLCAIYIISMHMCVMVCIRVIIGESKSLITLFNKRMLGGTGKSKVY